jgi:simple sugar transport system ATP-binding protein
VEREVVLQVKDLTKHYGGIHAVQDVSFDVRKAEVVGLLGDNGAGKSTLVKMISGVTRPTRGSVFFMGERVDSTSPRELRERGIETIYQDLALADNLGVTANMFLGREHLRVLFGVTLLDEKKMQDQAEKILQSLKINIPSTRTRVRDLSGGQRQSVAIGRAIFWNAKLIILDEPTAALGVRERANVLDLIKSLKEQEVSVILISHNLTDVFEVTDRLVVLRRGVKIRELETKHTTEHEVVHLMIGSES